MECLLLSPKLVLTLSPFHGDTNHSNYTALSGSPSGALVKRSCILICMLQAYRLFQLSPVGRLTTITTTAPHRPELVGSEVAFRIANT